MIMVPVKKKKPKLTNYDLLVAMQELMDRIYYTHSRATRWDHAHSFTCHLTKVMFPQ